MTSPTATIPFERQTDAALGRTCGAACLTMVYRSFGRPLTQNEVWPGIAKVNRFGSLASTTHLMTRDAIRRGFQAIAIGAREPIQLLRLCHRSGIRVILNHRLEADSDTGHYTVLTGIDDRGVTLHDPFYGPFRVVSNDELLALWQPRKPESEITGNALIAIGLPDPAADAGACHLCHSAIPPIFDCPRCKHSIALTPPQVLSCIAKECRARNWNFVCCPSCDSLWDFHQAEPEPEKPKASAVIPESVDRAAERLTAFINQVLTVPGAAEHPEIQQHLELLARKREGLYQAFEEGQKNKELHLDQLQKFQTATDRNAAAQRERASSFDVPATELDGNALGKSLLRELGFTA
jgi:hypothetical protein